MTYSVAAMGRPEYEFFHKVTQGRASKITIKKLMTEDGVVFTDIDEIKQEAVKYYKLFL